MNLFRSEGTEQFDDLGVRMTVVELLPIDRAMRQYDQAVWSAGRQTEDADQEVLAGLYDIVNELKLQSPLPWP